MKTTIICAAIVGMLAAVANAQPAISWSTAQNILNDFDVNTSGTLYASWNPQNGSPQNVNGVSFSGGLPGLSISAGFDAGYNAYPPSPSGSAAYNTDLQYGAYTYGGVDTFSWNGMTSGNSYLVQMWFSTGHNERTDTITAGNSVNVTEGVTSGSSGQYVIETISMTGPYPNLNMIQIRDITPVPEPSTLAFLATGTGALLLALRRKSRAV